MEGHNLKEIPLQLNGKFGGIVMNNILDHRADNNIKNSEINIPFCLLDPSVTKSNPLQMGQPMLLNKSQQVTIQEIHNDQSQLQPNTSSYSQESSFSSSVMNYAPIENMEKAIVPFGALSPISQVSMSLSSVSLKRGGFDDIETPAAKKKEKT